MYGYWYYYELDSVELAETQENEEALNSSRTEDVATENNPEPPKSGA